MQKFSVITMLLKGVLGGIGGGAYGALIQWVLDGIQTGNWAMSADAQSLAITLIVSAATAIHVMVKNAWSNRDKLKTTKVSGGLWIAIFATSLLVQGCNTMTPALAGKTNLTTTFSDVVTPDGGQNTQYQQTVKAPAGVQLENIASMGYKWNPDGSGDIAIASAPKADTQGQADALVQVNAQQMELIGKMMEQIVALAGIASPLVGGKITADATAQAAAIANKAQLQALVADIVKQALAQQGAAAKNYVQLPK